jgi:hypothetical protein
MLKILRLSHDQARSWRTNEMFLVDMNEKIVRPATPAEQNEWSRYQMMGHDLELEDENGNKLRFRSARNMLKAAILSEHGDTQIRWPNGIIITTVRDPGRPRMSLAESQKVSPSPAHCECVAWGEPHPGRHHPVCQWNQYAPENERGDVRAASFVPGQPVVMKVSEIVPENSPKPAVASTTPRSFAAPLAPPAPVVPEPLGCPECHTWLNPDGTPASKRRGHHPICRHHDAWEALHPITATNASEMQELGNETVEVSKDQTDPAPPLETDQFYLFTIDSRDELRPALPDEIQEAEMNLANSGTPTITRDEIVYLVTTRSNIAASLGDSSTP